MESVSWHWVVEVSNDGDVPRYTLPIRLNDDMLRDTYFERDPDDRPVVRWRALNNAVTSLSRDMDQAAVPMERRRWRCWRTN